MNRTRPPDADGLIDLGHGHAYALYTVEDDRGDNVTAGAHIFHPAPKDAACRVVWGEKHGGRGVGSVLFDIPATARFNSARWTVTSWSPLTVHPSIRCRECGDHGYIRDGKWEPA